MRNPIKKLCVNNASIIYTILLSILVIKLLWGYWDRDLTANDTSSYFIDGLRWYYNHQINFIWSPLYTAYYGSWLNISDNAVLITWLHRIGLIFISTLLLAWLAAITLPRLLALFLVIWWIALPIHYDTLYEIHLFGALPIFVMALVALLANERWKGPVLMGVALVAMILIRNEYILVIGVFITLSALKLIIKIPHDKLNNIWSMAPQYVFMLIFSGLIGIYFYSISYVKGEELRAHSKPKHTLNMCQVYTFGYQQRHHDSKVNPWIDCASLMEVKFEKEYPSLVEMALSNPAALIEHFLWNLSLTRAGMEVLLFNSTTAKHNPDYVPVRVNAVWPTALLIFTLGIILSGAITLYRTTPDKHRQIRSDLSKMAPLLLAVLVMSLAVILTQRPRPSYLLGLGMLYMWVVSIFLSLHLSRFAVIKTYWLPSLILVTSIVLLPSYHSLQLPSQRGILEKIYLQLKPQAAKLCKSSGSLAVGYHASSINNYLCSPFGDHYAARHDLLRLQTMPKDNYSSPLKFVVALENLGVDRVVIDPYLNVKHSHIGSCAMLNDVFLERNWEQLTYSLYKNTRCIAAYAKQ